MTTVFISTSDMAYYEEILEAIEPNFTEGEIEVEKDADHTYVDAPDELIGAGIMATVTGAIQDAQAGRQDEPDDGYED